MRRAAAVDLEKAHQHTDRLSRGAAGLEGYEDDFVTAKLGAVP